MGYLKKLLKYKDLLWFVFALFFFTAFLALFEDVILEKSVTNIDVSIANWVYTLRTPILNEIMKIITYFSSVEIVAVVLLTVVLVLFFLKKRKYIYAILISTIFSEGFVYIMKILVQKPRPAIQNALITETSFSFPSGHAMVAVAVYGLLFYFLIQICKQQWQKIVLVVAGVVLILSIGFSRVYLGVHWPTDVLASYLLGGSWICLLIGYINNSKRIYKLFGKSHVNKINNC